MRKKVKALWHLRLTPQGPWAETQTGVKRGLQRFASFPIFAQCASPSRLDGPGLPRSARRSRQIPDGNAMELQSSLLELEVRCCVRPPRRNRANSPQKPTME